MEISSAAYLAHAKRRLWNLRRTPQPIPKRVAFPARCGTVSRSEAVV